MYYLCFYPVMKPLGKGSRDNQMVIQLYTDMLKSIQKSFDILHEHFVFYRDLVLVLHARFVLQLVMLRLTCFSPWLVDCSTKK